MSVYKAINAVQRALSKTGIAKDRTNTQGATYKFRGIDDVYNAISPLMAEHGLCILPRMLERSCEERQSQKGNALFYVTVKAEFDFVSTEDGSKHTVATYGEAMDSGDKATNKAMSAAYKYAAFQAFAIPTEGDNDADSHTHEVVRKERGGVASQVMDTSPPLSDARKAVIERLAGQVKSDFEAYGPETAYERIELEGLDNLEKIYLGTLLPSNVRNPITAHSRSIHKREKASA
jgi:hypothetical protein